MGGKIWATPWVTILGFLIFTTCALLVLRDLTTGLSILRDMGALNLAIDGFMGDDMVFDIAFVTFMILWGLDLIMLAFIWHAKLALRDEGPCDKDCGCMPLCQKIFQYTLMAVFWGTVIVLLVVALLIPLFAAVLVAGEYLCGLGDTGVDLLVHFTTTLLGPAVAAGNLICWRTRARVCLHAGLGWQCCHGCARPCV